MPDEKGSATTPEAAPEAKGEKTHLYFPVPYPTNGNNANETISTLSVHPQLMAAVVQKVAEKGTVTVSGKTRKNPHTKAIEPLTGTVLPDGAFALWLREIIADAAGYAYATPSDLCLPLKGKGKTGTGTGVQAQALKAKTLGVVRQVFASIRGSFPEAQARELALKIAIEQKSALSDEEISALWNEAS